MVLVQVFKHCNLLLQCKLITVIYFSYLQLEKRGKLNCSGCSKYFKTTGGLRRHQRHCSKSETQLEKDTTQQIFQETISDVFVDECYPDEVKIELKTSYLTSSYRLFFHESSYSVIMGESVENPE